MTIDQWLTCSLVLLVVPSYFSVERLDGQTCVQEEGEGMRSGKESGGAS